MTSATASLIRVLHCLETPADFEARQSVSQLAESLGPPFQCQRMILGGSGVPSISYAVARLRRLRREFDLLHVWSPMSLVAAVLAWGDRPIIYSPPPVLSRRALGWLRAAASYRKIHFAGGSAHQQSRLLRGGISPDRCRLIRPAVDFGRLRRRRDDALRRRLRLEPSDFVLLLTGESTRASSHLRGIWTAGILHVIDSRYKVLLPGHGPQARYLKAVGGRVASEDTVRFADSELGGDADISDLYAAADMVLVPAEGPVHTLPIAWAMAAGLPIVGCASAVVSELLEDHHTALLTRTADPRQMAHRVLTFREDSALEWTLSDRARAEAYDYFSQSRFLREYREFYETIASQGGQRD